jgi:hypothetical protein
MCKGRRKVPQNGGVDCWDKFGRVVEHGFSEAVLCLSTMEVLRHLHGDRVIDSLTAANADLAVRILMDGAIR